MVSSCCVKGCTEKFVKGGGVSYFRISSKPEMQRNAWILALKRNGWIPKPHHRICSRHFVTGTWNADPNHIDYIPTRGMSNELGYLFESTAIHNNNLDTSAMDSSICASPNAGITETFTSSNTNGSFHQQCTSVDNSVGNHQSESVKDRVLITGVSFNQCNTTLVTSSRRRPRKLNKKALHKSWSSAPRLTSSHFCEHQDAHRNCCRVIRELAEENQILKSQVSCLLYQMEQLRERGDGRSSPPPFTEEPLGASVPPIIIKRKSLEDVLGEPSINGDTETTGSDNPQDVEVVTESPPSLGINEELVLISDELDKEEDQSFAIVDVSPSIKISQDTTT